jgi:hypothetical protein
MIDDLMEQLYDNLQPNGHILREYPLRTLMSANPLPSDETIQTYMHLMAKGHIESEINMPIEPEICIIFDLAVENNEADIKSTTTIHFAFTTEDYFDYLEREIILEPLMTSIKHPNTIKGYKDAFSWLRAQSQQFSDRGICHECRSAEDATIVMAMESTDLCEVCTLRSIVFTKNLTRPELQMQLTPKLIELIGENSTELVHEFIYSHPLGVYEEILEHIHNTGPIEATGEIVRPYADTGLKYEIVATLSTRGDLLEMKMEFFKHRKEVGLYFGHTFPKAPSGVRLALEYAQDVLGCVEQDQTRIEYFALSYDPPPQ